MDDNVLLRVLPLEVWSIILEQLTAAEDLMNASKCFSLFREILLKNRVHFLFKNVLNVVVSVKKETIEGSQNNNSTQSSYILKNEIIHCRTVCTSWNTAVEEFYETPEYIGNFPQADDKKKYPKDFNPNEWLNPYIFTVYQPFRAQLFVSKFIDGDIVGTRNPFLGRLIVMSIGLHVRTNLNVFTNAIETILVIFGAQIWFATINMKYSRFTNASEDYVKLRSFITLMPNLKSLRVHFHSYGAVGQDTIENNPLPELNNLTHLGISNVGVHVLNEMLRKYCHVSYLEINKCGPIREWLPVRFTELKGLLLDTHCQACSDEALHCFGSVTNLEILSVHNQKRDLKFCKQFEIITRYWSNSLTTLKLKIENEGLEEIKCPRNLHLKLSRLSTLKIYSYRSICIDFVKTLKSLEYLDVSLCPNDFKEDEKLKLYNEKNLAEQKIQFFGFENQMQVSNIWTFLSKLKIIRVNITRRQPILCYEYVRSQTGVITCRSFVQKAIPNVKVPHTYDYVFKNFET